MVDLENEKVFFFDKSPLYIEFENNLIFLWPVVLMFLFSTTL
jgi:hypothetical protein